MKLTLLAVISALAGSVAEASVVVSWTTSDIEAARAWLASLDFDDGGRGGQVYSTIEELPVPTHSLIGRLMIGGDLGTLVLFGQGAMPLNFDLVFLNPFSGPRVLISGLSADFTEEDSEPSAPLNSSRFSYSGTFNLQPAEWRLLGISDSLELRAYAEDQSLETIPFQLKAIPEPQSVVLVLLGSACFLSRSRHSGVCATR